MWKLFIEMIERAWREKPRKDLIKEIVQLRQAMRACQTSYEDYKANPSEGTLQWDNSLATLQQRIMELDQVLQIFDSETRQAIENYYGPDSIEFGLVNGYMESGGKYLTEQIVPFDDLAGC